MDEEVGSDTDESEGTVGDEGGSDSDEADQSGNATLDGESSSDSSILPSVSTAAVNSTTCDVCCCSCAC